jgi:uncharacterized protein (DUF433 family)
MVTTMSKPAHETSNVVYLGVGYYTLPEAARLLRMQALTVRRWLGGYSYRDDGVERHMAPLWTPMLPAHDGHIELTFRDLIELRFVNQFNEAGVGLRAIRTCLNLAREVAGDSHPFSSRRFRTDGRTIFMETIRESDKDSELLDLKQRQYVIGRVLERTFKDMDIDDAAVTRWRPYNGKASIVIDPTRSFGQPIANDAGIPTATIADAVKAEGSAKRVAYLYGVAETVVRDADSFERSLLAA